MILLNTHLTRVIANKPIWVLGVSTRCGMSLHHVVYAMSPTVSSISTRFMPIDRQRYPKNWIKIANSAKDAADWRCQHCRLLCLRPGQKPPFLNRSEWTKLTLSVHHANYSRRQPSRESNCFVYALPYSASQSSQALKCLARAIVNMVSRCGAEVSMAIFP